VAKHVFKSVKLKDLGKPISIDTATFETSDAIKEAEESEEKLGATIEDFESEMRTKRRKVDEEIETKREEFQQEIDEIKQNSETWAFDKVKEASEQYEQKIIVARQEAEKKIADAQAEAQKIVQNASEEAALKKNESQKLGFDSGREEGFSTGKEEVERLIQRLNIILSSAIKKRNEIIEESEAQIIDLIITMARKVVKTITESQKRVVYDNITEALKHLKGRSEVTIRVNTEDLQMTTKHKKEFIQMVEGIEQIRILEDNTVEKGGCYISTDFGSIDAKISTQLSEIEEQIKKISPIKEEFN